MSARLRGHTIDLPINITIAYRKAVTALAGSPIN